MTENFRVAGFVIGLAIKAPVKATSSINVVSLNGAGQTLDGFVTSAFDRVLLLAQTDPIDNGIYSVRTSDWVRDGDFDGNRDIVGGTIVPAYRQSDGEIILYNVDGVPDALEVGADAINFSTYYDPTAAGINEAPNDGMSYVRNSLAWVLESTSTLPTPSVSSVLAGDGGGTNWLVANNITINQSSGTLSTDAAINLSDGVDQVAMRTIAGELLFVGTGGIVNIGFIPRCEFNDEILIQEQPSPAFSKAAWGTYWVASEGPNVPMFTDDTGEEVLIDPSRSSVNLQNGNYTTVMADRGKTIRKSSGGAGETYTIDSEANVPYKIGTFLGFDNDGGGSLSIAIAGADTLIFADDGSTGTRTLADGGFAVAHKNAAGQWKIAGKQLT